jgi:DNA-binding CsgD family transcriptional regulator
MPANALTAGREAFDARRWRDACDHLTAADGAHPLEPDDLHLLATAAYLAGDPCWQTAWARAYESHTHSGDSSGAAHAAFWLVMAYFSAGEIAQGGGWLARVQRHVDAMRGDCVEAGYVLLPAAIAGCDTQPESSLAAFDKAREIGERFHDNDLTTLARHGEARCIIVLGEAPRGLAMFDEMLVTLATSDLSPIVVGDTYCGAVEACQITFDVRRAREWTAALNRWCESQPGLEAFRGPCLIYVSAVTQLRGDWNRAIDVANQALRHLSEPVPHPSVGAAHYQRAELERLRGDVTAADASYQNAAEHGRDPQPGLALLRLAAGEVSRASAGIQRALAEAGDPVARSALLPAFVEIMLEVNDHVAARDGAAQLDQIADVIASPFLRAHASYATGAVLIAGKQSHEALPHLRSAVAGFRELDAPFEAARARVLIGLACRELGDADGAAAEFGAARHVFEELGAQPEIRRLDSLLGEPSPPGGLTPREIDILRLVATGKTNRAIGDELVISEKTVARHVSNIFDKLGVSSRAAATAYAYDHRLL